MLRVALCAAILAPAFAAEPLLGRSPRYCNPLPIVSGGGVSASGDVTVIRDNGQYYMYCTGGGAWVSDDLLHWTLHRVDNVPVAPDVVKYNGAFYLCGNSGPLFKADNPLGPFTRLGTGRRGSGGRGRRAEPTPATATEVNAAPVASSALARPPTDAYQYKIEVSTDGTSFATALDQSTNAMQRNTIFEEIPPARCRFVRLTMVNWPHATPLGVIEFTVFGRPTGSLPAVQPVSYDP